MTRRVVSWAVILAVTAVALTFVPGFDVLSFYFCLPIALLLGMAGGGLAVTTVAETRDRGGTLRDAAVRALGITLLMTAIPLAIVTVSAFRVGPCDYPYGLRFYLAGPAASALFGAAIGFAVGVVVPRRRVAGALFPALFVATFVVNLIDLYRSPAVFFYNPFLGYYPGPIYDDRIEVTGAYLAFRACCALVAVAAIAGAVAWVRDDLSLRRRPRALPLALAIAATFAAVGVGLHAGDLGFRVTRADVERALPARAADDLCVIRHDGTADPGQIDRLLWDCGFQHRRMAAFFGLAPEAPVRVFLYPDADTKARLMGARHVEVSKPWLREVHITMPQPGDPVLGHEIAHAVAERLAPGFLGVPVRYGVVPDMAIVEGLAVAAAFADDGPSRHEWALAMIRAGLPVDPVALFEPGAFLGAGAGSAYTIAGSVVAFVAHVHGTTAVQALARGEGFVAATGQPLPDLIPRWRTYLEATVGTTVDRALIDRAAGRFSDPGVLRRRCPTDVARALHAVDEAYRDGDPVAALAALRTARELDPGFRALAREAVRVGARVGDPDALADAEALLAPPDPEISPTPLDRVAAADAWMLAPEAGADAIAWARDELSAALLAFGRGPEARGVCARLMALDMPDDVRAAVFAGLAGGLGPDPAGPLLEALSVHPDTDLVRYLLGRLDLGQGRYAAAAILLGDLSDRRWPVVPDDAPSACAPLFSAELAKIAAIAAFWSGHVEDAARRIDRAAAQAASQGESLLLDEYRERVRQVGASAAGWTTAPAPREE
jgi:hypothetical protein